MAYFWNHVRYITITINLDITIKTNLPKLMGHRMMRRWSMFMYVY